MKNQTTELEKFIKECLLSENTLAVSFSNALSKMSDDKDIKQNVPPRKLEPYKASKSELIFVTARNLGMPEEDVKDALNDGKFLSLFKKKNKKLTPEIVQKVKDAYSKYQKAIEQWAR